MPRRIYVDNPPPDERTLRRAGASRWDRAARKLARAADVCSETKDYCNAVALRRCMRLCEQAADHGAPPGLKRKVTDRVVRSLRTVRDERAIVASVDALSAL